MANETTITLIGNMTSDPELRFVPSGAAVANFTVASTPKVFDKQSQEWKDQETLFMRCNVWREMAESVAESLTKGMRVIVTGRLTSRSWDDKEGTKRTVIELEIDEIGPSLKYATAKVTKAARNNAAGSPGFAPANTGFGVNPPQTGNNQPADPWAAQPANAGGWGNGPDSEPPF